MGCLSLSSVSLPLLLYGILPVQPYPPIIALLFCKDNNHTSHAGLALQPPIQCNSIFVSQARLNHIQIISRLQTLLELALHCMIGRNTEDAALEAKQPPSLSEHLCLLARDPHQWALHSLREGTSPEIPSIPPSHSHAILS